MMLEHMLPSTSPTSRQLLNLPLCARITDASVAQLTSPPAATDMTLVSLNVTGCRLLTELSLDYLLKCQSFKYLELRNTTQMSAQKVVSFTTIGGRHSSLTNARILFS